ncbi:MAG: hypothetical protein R3B90_09210 [Planctomycetaceae bacterium]
MCRGDTATESLVRQLPAGINTIGILRMGQLMQSSRAQQEQWKQRQEERFLSGAASLPPNVELYVTGSLLRLGAMSQEWSGSLVRLPIGVNMEAVAAHEQASIEELAGQPTVRSSRDCYISLLKLDLLGVYRPASRQEAGRWLQSVAEGQTTSPSPYLLKAAGVPGDLVMAMDVEHLLDPTAVRQHLQQDARLKQHAALTEKLVPLVVGLKGITLSVMVDVETSARIDIEFSQDPTVSRFAVKAILVSMLEDLGVAIDEFDGSDVAAEGNSVVLTCKLSDESLRRLASLIVPHAATSQASSQVATAAETTPAPAAEPPKTPDVPVDPLAATREYVKAVNRIIADLQAANTRAKNYQRTAGWHDSFANKIESLGTAGVAKDAIQFANSTASHLRALAASLRGEAVAVSAEEGALTYNVSRDPGWVNYNVWGWGGGGGVGYRAPTTTVTSNIQQVREKQAAAVSAGAQQREQIWARIHDEQAAMRQRLEDR